jgi:flavin-dependent dehydrogenase
MLAASEIAVVGGGPAGAIVAARLAELGHDVVLLEGVHFPRPHVGDALTPGVGEQLAFLKLGDVLDSALARRTPEFELRWRTDSFESYRATQPGLLVERGIFDAGLVAAARRRGVRLLEATRARVAERVAGCWRIACDSRQGTRIVTAALMIDAGGRRGLLPKRRHKQYGLLAIHGRLRGLRLPNCVRVSAGNGGWAWGAPMRDGTFAAMVFLDPRDVRSTGDGLEQRFRNLLAACRLLDDAGPTDIVGPIQACDATPYLDKDAVGADFLKIGDASLTIDPISSAGVQSAIQSAIAGAVAVHTLRRNPASALVVAEFWSRELARRHARHQAWSAQFYREAGARFASPFWRARSVGKADDASLVRSPGYPPLPGPSQALRLAKSVRIAIGPCIVGDVIEQRRLVTHPSLGEPVAFVENLDLPELLARIGSGATAAAVIDAWSGVVSPARAISVLTWAWRHGLIESQTENA